MKNTHFEHGHLEKHLDDGFSNAIGSRRGSYHGGTRSHINYVRRNLGRTYYGGGYGYGYPYAVGVIPATALYVDNINTNPPAISGDIKITKRGLKYLKKHPKGVNGIFLSYIKSENRFDAAKLRKELQLKDFNRVVGFMNSQKLIEIIK
jgi:hypothetical protein